MLIDYYTEFTNNTIEDYFKNNLENENEEYAAIINEYRYGLLIFDVMEKNIWTVAKNDSIGLQKYYEKHEYENDANGLLYCLFPVLRIAYYLYAGISFK